MLFIVAAASIFGWMLTATGVTTDIAAWVLGFTQEAWVFLLLANLLMLFVGCFLEPTAAITILVPILVLAFGFAQPTAQGTSLAVMVPMSLVGALSYRFLAGVPLEFSSTLYLSIGAVVGAIAGSRIPAWFSAPMAQRLFAVLLILIAVRMLLVVPPEASAGDLPQRGSEEPSA